MPSIDVISANLPLLRELRDRIGQLELAEKVGVSRRTIARLENAEVTDPGIELMTRIADALGVSLALLTERKAGQVTLVLPNDVRKRLASAERAEVLDAMISAARR
ncbi:MAG: helix-turn-helix transcriptional regulator [Polyangiales bacterium]